MDFNALIAELRAASENLPNQSADRSLLSSVYCNKACKALDQLADGGADYETVITGLWLIAAHFAEQLPFVKPVPALSELCFKLFRQCAKAVLNIQWQNLEEDSSLKQRFLVSLANLHAKLVPFDFPRFRLLEALTKNPWTNPTLAKVMGGEIEDGDKEEVRQYIEQEDPIILQLRVDMMLKENCEEYALNLCNSCLSHPELQSDLSVRKTQLSLLYSLGQEDKLQEECQKLSIQDAVRIIKQFQTSKSHRQICTVLAQTFMVQNWIRPSDMEANKELLRLWIRHQLLVDREQDQFKESVWAMAKLSQSTEQIVIFIDVLREECGDTFLQLYVDLCIFAINVDKGQMETNIKEGNVDAARARRSDMASICAKLSCLCHHTSIKVARICALTSFALKPSEQSFAKIGTFYGQGRDCCNKCSLKQPVEPGTVNPATLYEVERLLNMLRPDYLNPDHPYTNIQILCRRFLQESLRNAQQRKQLVPQNSSGTPVRATTQLEGPGKKKMLPPTASRPTNVFEALSVQDVQNTQMLLNRMRMQDIASSKTPPSPQVQPGVQRSYVTVSSRPNILQHGHQQQQPGNTVAGQASKAHFMFDADKVKNKQPYGVPIEQQHQYYLMKHEKEQEQRRKNAQRKRDEKNQHNLPLTPQSQQLSPQLLQQQQQQQQQQKQLQLHQNKQVTQIIECAMRQDSSTLQKLTQSASPEVMQAVLNIMKGTVSKPSQQQQPVLQQVKQTPSQQGTQPLPTVSTLLKPSIQSPQQQQQQQQQPQQSQPPPYREQPPPRRYPRPQLYAQPIIVSTSNNLPPMMARPQPSAGSMPNPQLEISQSASMKSPSVVSNDQKAESYRLAKTHVEDIRKFMQMQMSNLQQKQIAETRQMSGSTVTLMNNTPTSASTGGLQLSLSSRPRTTVELAQQAAQAKLEKQQQQAKQATYLQQQQKLPHGQVFSSQSNQMGAKPSQLSFGNTVSRTSTTVPLPPSHQQQQQLRLTHVQQQQLQQSSAFSNQNNSASSVAQSTASVLPSSDELSGSIMGIDDTIIRELLQDSGILANTFPDIEVDTVGDDKSKKISEFSISSQHLSSSQTPVPGLVKQVTCYSSPPTSLIRPQIKPGLSPRPSLSQPTQGNSATRLNQPPNVGSASHLPATYSWQSGNQVNKFSSLPSSSSSVNSVNSPVLSNVNTVSIPSAQSRSSLPVSSLPQFGTNKSPVSVLPRENISVLPKKEKKPDLKLTVDQLREMMQKEDIQGEVCMDAANNATYRCIICSLAFETLENLREHVRNVCKPGLQSSSVYNTKIKQDRANSAKAGLETTTVFQCLRCFELCVSDAGIKQHRLTCKRVPTVPSDLKKEEQQPTKTKASTKHAASKQSGKQEPKDNSHKVPEMPLPFPYPSLNAQAVLKSLSLTGSNASSGISKSPTSVISGAINSKPPTSITSSTHTSQPQTSSILTTTTPTISPSVTYSQSRPPTSASLLTTDKTLQTQVSTLNVIGSSSSVAASTVTSVQTTVASESQDLVSSAASDKTNMDQVDADEKNSTVKPEPKEGAKELPPPSFTEISGSGGSKFYKCKICLQTLCSLESFHVHWKECVVKNKSLLERRESREKLLKARALSGEVLENVLSVISAVADGVGEATHIASFEAEMTEEEHKLLHLRDPCLETGDGAELDEDVSPMPWETDEFSGSENQSESGGVTDGEKGGGNKWKKARHKGYDDEGTDQDEGDYSTGTTEKESGDDDTIFKKSKKKFNEETEDEEEDDEDEDDDESVSESERRSSLVSTREAPPKLRDRKTLKPIQSFINETFVSPYSKGVKAAYSKGEDKDIAEDSIEKITSGSEVESDGDSLYCKVCKRFFETKRMLLQHYAGKHLQPYTVKTVADSSSYFCHLCQKTFSTFMHYMQHVPNHSVTIYEKMKAFTVSRKSSQRSERIASQRGFTRKSPINPKLAKALKSKKAATKSAVDRLKRQLLSGNTRSLRDRLRLSKRKRSLPINITSSEDDYSSDASNNVVFKSRRSTESGNRSDGQRPVTRRGRELARRKEESHSHDDESYYQSSDVSTGGDSDESRKDPPTTRSRKRSDQIMGAHSGSKRRKVSSDPECEKTDENDSEVSEYEQKKSRAAISFVDSDADSNCTTLFLSEGNDGNFMPVTEKVEIKSESNDIVAEAKHAEAGTEDEADQPHKPRCRVAVRSISKEQKEQLKSCDLHPTVVLQMLSPSNFNKSPGDGNSKEKSDSEDSGCAEVTTSSAEGGSKKPSFLDSFLSYLNRYSANSSGNSGTPSSRQRNRSGPASVEKPRNRRNSSDTMSLLSSRCESPAAFSRTSSMELESSVASMDASSTGEAESNIPDNMMQSESGQGSVHSFLAKFPTRRCSVNLGEKIDPDSFRATLHRPPESESSNAAQSSGFAGAFSSFLEHEAKFKNAGSTFSKGKLVPSLCSKSTEGFVKVSKSVSEGKQMPIVCLERSKIIDKYAINKTIVSEVFEYQNLSSEEQTESTSKEIEDQVCEVVKDSYETESDNKTVSEAKSTIQSTEPYHITADTPKTSEGVIPHLNTSHLNTSETNQPNKDILAARDNQNKGTADAQTLLTDRESLLSTIDSTPVSRPNDNGPPSTANRISDQSDGSCKETFMPLPDSESSTAALEDKFLAPSSDGQTSQHGMAGRASVQPASEEESLTLVCDSTSLQKSDVDSGTVLSPSDSKTGQGSPEPSTESTVSCSSLPNADSGSSVPHVPNLPRAHNRSSPSSTDGKPPTMDSDSGSTQLCAADGSLLPCTDLGLSLPCSDSGPLPSNTEIKTPVSSTNGKHDVSCPDSISVESLSDNSFSRPVDNAGESFTALHDKSHVPLSDKCSETVSDGKTLSVPVDSSSCQPVSISVSPVHTSDSESSSAETDLQAASSRSLQAEPDSTSAPAVSKDCLSGQDNSDLGTCVNSASSKSGQPQTSEELSQVFVNTDDVSKPKEESEGECLMERHEMKNVREDRKVIVTDESEVDNENNSSLITQRKEKLSAVNDHVQSHIDAKEGGENGTLMEQIGGAGDKMNVSSLNESSCQNLTGPQAQLSTPVTINVASSRNDLSNDLSSHGIGDKSGSNSHKAQKKHKTSNSHSKTIKNPSISLAAFIAERLLRDNSEPDKAAVGSASAGKGNIASDAPSHSKHTTISGPSKSETLEGLGLVDYSSSDGEGDDGRADHKRGCVETVKPYQDIGAVTAVCENSEVGDESEDNILHGEDCDMHKGPVGISQDETKERKILKPVSYDQTIMLTRAQYSHSVFFPGSSADLHHKWEGRSEKPISVEEGGVLGSKIDVPSSILQTAVKSQLTCHVECEDTGMGNEKEYTKAGHTVLSVTTKTSEFMTQSDEDSDNLTRGVFDTPVEKIRNDSRLDRDKLNEGDAGTESQNNLFLHIPIDKIAGHETFGNLSKDCEGVNVSENEGYQITARQSKEGHIEHTFDNTCSHIESKAHLDSVVSSSSSSASLSCEQPKYCSAVGRKIGEENVSELSQHIKSHELKEHDLSKYEEQKLDVCVDNKSHVAEAETHRLDSQGSHSFMPAFGETGHGDDKPGMGSYDSDEEEVRLLSPEVQSAPEEQEPEDSNQHGKGFTLVKQSDSCNQYGDIHLLPGNGPSSHNVDHADQDQAMSNTSFPFSSDHLHTALPKIDPHDKSESIVSSHNIVSNFQSSQSKNQTALLSNDLGVENRTTLHSSVHDDENGFSLTHDKTDQSKIVEPDVETSVEIRSSALTVLPQEKSDSMGDDKSAIFANESGDRLSPGNFQSYSSSCENTETADLGDSGQFRAKSSLQIVIGNEGMPCKISSSNFEAPEEVDLHHLSPVDCFTVNKRLAVSDQGLAKDICQSLHQGHSVGVSKNDREAQASKLSEPAGSHTDHSNISCIGDTHGISHASAASGEDVVETSSKESKSDGVSKDTVILGNEMNRISAEGLTSDKLDEATAKEQTESDQSTQSQISTNEMSVAQQNEQIESRPLQEEYDSEEQSGMVADGKEKVDQDGSSDLASQEQKLAANTVVQEVVTNHIDMNNDVTTDLAVDADCGRDHPIPNIQESQKTHHDNLGDVQHASKEKTDDLEFDNTNEVKEDDSADEGAKDPDDGDDLSDFDLVIEQDTSCRNVLSFSSQPEKTEASPHQPKAAILYGPKTTAVHALTSTKAVKVTSDKNISCEVVKSELSAEVSDPSPAPRKPLRGAKALRKGSQEQFVWDVDDEDPSFYRTKTITVTHPLPITAVLATMNTQSAVEKKSVEALRRKQKALREKLETPPFTEDWEDHSDSSRGSPAQLTAAAHAFKKESVDACKLEPIKSEDGAREKACKRTAQRKRPWTPEITPAKKPAKVRRTSSVEKHANSSSFVGVREPKKEIKPEVKNEKVAVNRSGSSETMKERENDNSIAVDDEISFKKDSFTPPLSILDSVPTAQDQHSPLSNVDESEGKAKRRRRGRPPKSLLSERQPKLGLNEVEKRLSPQINSEEVIPKNSPELRSRHSSVESNKSDKSVSSKRQSDSSPQITVAKRPRKSEDPLTPRLRKAGLIKIIKDTNSTPASTGLDSTAPMTRSSEAAIKAFNQKSLRNRGVNPVTSTQSSPSTPKAVPVNVSPKTNSEGSPKLKHPAVTALRSPSLSSHSFKHSAGPDIKTTSNPGSKTKTESSSKTATQKTNDSPNATAAVVRRRAPPPPPSSRVRRTKPPLTPKPMKGQLPASTTVFRVDPLATTSITRGASKPTESVSSKGDRTVHTALPPGTTSVKPKNDSPGKARWKINKETKLVRSRKQQQKGSITFKRT